MLNPDSPKRLRDRMKEATRDAILAAAEDVIGRDGGSAKVEDIARAAGVSVGTVYNHFEDRDAVFSALMDLRHGELLERVERAHGRTKKEPFEARLRAFVAAAVEHFEAHRALFAAVMEGDSPRRRGDAKRVTMRELALRAEALVRAGVKEGVLRAQDQELFSAFLVSSVRGVLMRSFMKGEGEDLRTSVDAVVRFFLQGAGKR